MKPFVGICDRCGEKKALRYRRIRCQSCRHREIRKAKPKKARPIKLKPRSVTQIVFEELIKFRLEEGEISESYARDILAGTPMAAVRGLERGPHVKPAVATRRRCAKCGRPFMSAGDRRCPTCHNNEKGISYIAEGIGLYNPRESF